MALDIWLLKDGEILPIQEESRKMRTWMLADALIARGHRVTWWASTFAHQKKALLARADRVIELGPRFTLRLIHAGAYRTNLSLRRYAHHRRVGRLSATGAPSLPAPAGVIAAFPVIDLAAAAVRYARERHVPTL